MTTEKLNQILIVSPKRKIFEEFRRRRKNEGVAVSYQF